MLQTGKNGNRSNAEGLWYLVANATRRVFARYAASEAFVLTPLRIAMVFSLVLEAST